MKNIHRARHVPFHIFTQISTLFNITHPALGKNVKNGYGMLKENYCRSFDILNKLRSCQVTNL